MREIRERRKAKGEGFDCGECKQDFPKGREGEAKYLQKEILLRQGFGGQAEVNEEESVIGFPESWSIALTGWELLKARTDPFTINKFTSTGADAGVFLEFAFAANIKVKPEIKPLR